MPKSILRRNRKNVIDEAVALSGSQVEDNEVVVGKAEKTTELTAGDGLTGGGTLAADRTLSVGAGEGIAVTADAVNIDIDSLTVDASPDTAADYVATYDASASAHKKVLLSDLGATELNELSDVTITSPEDTDVLTYVASTYDFVLSGDMNVSSDELLLSGDMQSDTDALSLSGDTSLDSPIWKNIPHYALFANDVLGAGGTNVISAGTTSDYLGAG